ncbi:hypothetical protein RRG08_020510 [Elysia crispata]|uniref:Peptidase M12B domain-containing protein n=1 Tax=Elysia crispata TaxID=231223 RepID=A0AAE0YGT0_9GAST|nr:hypothetical protein RRG08_020510 [Elysia crispata]
MSLLTWGRLCSVSHATFFISIWLICMKQSLSTKVHVKYTEHYKSSDEITPEDLVISISNGSLNLGTAHLKRSPFDFNVPVYSLKTGADGKITCNQENLRDIKNVGFYQDVATEAVIQVTSTSDPGGSKPHLVLQGELSLGGQKYTLSPGTRHKRDVSTASPSSSPQSPSSTLSTLLSSSLPDSDDDDDYELTPYSSKASIRKDGLLAAPEIKISLSELIPEKPVLLSLRKKQKQSSSPSDAKASPFKQKSATFSFVKKSKNGRGSRRMRRQATVIYIDVVAVIDYGAYQRFLGNSASRSEALEALREYYAFVFNGMDLRYQNIPNVNYQIRVRLIKVIVSETRDASSFTEEFRMFGTPWDSVDALSALTSFSEYAVGTGADFLNPYDHSMLFTGYDLSSTEDTGSTLTTTGLAYTSTLCRTDGTSVSVVEDLGGFQSIDTATHELGHSLSAKHDGEENLCRSTDRYIMAGGTYPQTQTNALNPWKFSVCSVNYFITFIADERRTSRGSICLSYPLSISASIPDVSGRLPGQELSPDEQCVQIYGPSSRLCRGSEFGNDICTAMFCYDPSTEDTCFEQTAARGTTCGDGKLCLGGECVENPRAPSVDENCLFGDQPGAAFSGETCEAFVNDFTGYCYQELVRGRCCSSCKTIHRQVRDCEYGDHVDGCDSRSCPFADTDYLEQCCGTCNYGTPYTTTGTTMHPFSSTPIKDTQEPTTSAGCIDNSEILIDGMTCSEVTRTTPSRCYQDSVLAVCCASCEKVSSGVQGCEYGDRFPSACQKVTSCVGREQICCDTCRGGGDNAEVTTTTAPITPQPPSVCRDNPLIQVNRLPCQSAIQDDPSLCYNPNVARDCCFSCSQAHTGVNGCEYGDRYPDTCANLINCAGSVLQCCQTCSGGNNPGGGNNRNTATVKTKSSVSSVVISLVFTSVTIVFYRKDIKLL